METINLYGGVEEFTRCPKWEEAGERMNMEFVLYLESGYRGMSQEQRETMAEWRRMPSTDPWAMALFQAFALSQLGGEEPQVRVIDYSLRARYVALKRESGCCQLCGARASEDNPLEVDHIKPISRHPELAHGAENLQVLCHYCNIGKSNEFEDDWRAA